MRMQSESSCTCLLACDNKRRRERGVRVLTRSRRTATASRYTHTAARGWGGRLLRYTPRECEGDERSRGDDGGGGIYVQFIVQRGYAYAAVEERSRGRHLRALLV